MGRQHGKNGLLVDMFDIDALADKVVEALQAPGQYADLRLAARATVQKSYGVRESLARYRKIIFGEAAQPTLRKPHGLAVH